MMRYEFGMLILIGIIISILYLLPKIINHFLLRKLKDLPEIDRKLNEGIYNNFNALRAQYVIDFYSSIGLYTSKYDEEGETND